MLNETLHLYFLIAPIQKRAEYTVDSDLNFDTIVKRILKDHEAELRDSYQPERVRVYTYRTQLPCDMDVPLRRLNISSGMYFVIF